ncbi:TetR/AcrR family transcriptional regulator [Evansella halocellulosilytica]|uniref:TetR/AcrR family transcriptional regulator n=1 Tax=Evansella halocellulosilytica TaxID=2011013 RepID=UPI000BB836B6|nr:TetR/AcrR family transcriptional regulator [Evansella halocellulosilytica]
MPRTKEQFEAMRLATKDKIHSAAIKLFAKKGFSATGVQDIADSAGISTGLLYRHYKTKDELFNELVSYATVGIENLVKRFESDLSPYDIIREFTLEILNDFKKDDEFANFLMIMSQAFTMDHPSHQVQLLKKQSEAMMEQTAILIEKGQKLGQFKDGDVTEMAYYYFASIQGLAMMKLLLGEQFITPRLNIVTASLVKEDYLD